MVIMIFSYKSLSKQAQPEKLISVWFFVLLGSTLVMILIGAATRLTDSGLSMVEWRPFMGIIPPLSQAEWQRVFQLYQTIPEYQLLNISMELTEFMQIFFWEYLHRFWGRMLGFIFLVPVSYFWYKRQLDSRQVGCLLLIPFLGVCQAILGWWMVKSGLSVRVDVSQYRLVAHLFLALLIMLAIWEAYLRYHRILLHPIRWQLNGRLLFLGLVVATIFAGALVAGTRAGLIYNQFPFMGSGFIPSDYIPYDANDSVGLPYKLWQIIFFENPASVQFHHRILGMLTMLGAMALVSKYHHVYAVRYLLLWVSVQFMLGILTLLTGLWLLLALLHQMCGVLLLLGAWLIYRKEEWFLES